MSESSCIEGKPSGKKKPHLLAEEGGGMRGWGREKERGESKRERERKRHWIIILALMVVFTPAVFPTLHFSGTSSARSAWLQVHCGRVVRQDQR